MKTYKYTINGSPYTVTVNQVDDTTAAVDVNGESYTVEFEGKAKPKVSAPRPIVQPKVAAAGSAPAPRSKSASTPGDITSPLPGVIVSVNVKVGDTVQQGDTVLCLEAMKMENNIDADRSGKVASIAVSPGDSVMEGDVLITIGD